ncbi:MAG: hypothetical protein SGJ20_09620 [Planctomycetota bacterium]|nr:hypothetical protein [Planctomycetota bacterium]
MRANSDDSDGPGEDPRPVDSLIEAWANAPLGLTKWEPNDGGPALYGLRKEMIVDGVREVQMVWINQAQLRSIGIEHGL